MPSKTKTITLKLTADVLDALDENAILALRPALIGNWDWETTVDYLDLDGEPRRDTLRYRRVGNYVLCWPAIDATEPEEAVEYTEAFECESGFARETFFDYVTSYVDFRGFPIGAYPE